MDYATFWEKYLAIWQIRPDVEGAALIDNNGVLLKQSNFCQRDQRRIVTACCAAIVSVANQFSLVMHRNRVDSIYIQTEQGYLIILLVDKEFFLALLVRSEANLGVVVQHIYQISHQ